MLREDHKSLLAYKNEYSKPAMEIVDQMPLPLRMMVHEYGLKLIVKWVKTPMPKISLKELELRANFVRYGVRASPVLDEYEKIKQ